jgi:hypothetical protein
VEPLIQFTAGGTMGNIPPPSAQPVVPTAVQNPEEILLDEEEEAEEGDKMDVEQVKLPKSLFEKNVKEEDLKKDEEMRKLLELERLSKEAKERDMAKEKEKVRLLL